MAIFNVAFLGPSLSKKTGASGAKVLSNKLSILESSLLGEGDELSAGDLDILIDETRKAQNSGILTATQRSNYDVKIAKYQQQKESILVQRSENIKMMDEDMARDDVEMFKIFGDNPRQLTRAKVASLTLKINKLSDAIVKRELLGQDATDLLDEKESVKTEWDRRVETMKAAEAFKDKGDVAANQVAYVVTNDQGEVVKINYAPAGTMKGYAETNGTINGFRVYGKINDNVNGKNIFRIAYGGRLVEFKAADIMMPDAAHPGDYKPTQLIGDVLQMGPYAVGKHGTIDLTRRDFRERGGVQGIQMQRTIPKNSWAKGLDGTMYYRKQDGNFEKHINKSFSPEGVDYSTMYTILPQEERLIWKKTDKTIDHSLGIEPEEEMPMTTMETLQKGPLQVKQKQQGMSTAKPVTMSTAKPVARRTPQQPKEQASPGIVETAKRTFQGGVDYLKSKFR